ncbi:diguanylate cyclase [Halomonas sp. hl-4]|uniref:diguanylate cyclase n=1 Tax=Halomonas sp. hl-4 TaxID=1761789 RepID=UPI000BB79B82|nr:diguanylate cyclase [Halomonas sp. hl-4]SNY96659.1 response regulator receiver modulated diguanylate cyclase [Halomonas sp. hl-4]
MTNAPTLFQSFAIFDIEQRLIDWNLDFVEEFADAAPLLIKGLSARDIHAACLLPERALDLSWALNDAPPSAFEYINNRRSISVVQEISVNGSIFRIAQSTNAETQLHPAMPDQSAELLRSTALQISATVLKRRDQETLRLHELALTDGLTGVANRRYFDELLDSEWKRCKQGQLPLSVIFIDIDFFKRYNDLYGHVSGDECLKNIASSLRATLNRPRDLVARYGGEEFTCLLPETDLCGARHKAGELELAVKALAIPNGKSKVAPIVTISLGVATAQHVTGDNPLALVRAADKLLYQAKSDGRACFRSALFES